MEMELQFEHIDWNDLVEAEGDQEALDVLRNRSVELKRSFSLPSPSPPRSSPPRHHHHAPKRLTNSPRSTRSPQTAGGQFKVPRKHRRPLAPRSQNCGLQKPTFSKEAPMCDPQDLDHHYPALSRSCSQPSRAHVSSPSGLSYAQVAITRNTKRTASERLCLSPIEAPCKRLATSDLVKTPTGLRVESQVFSEEWVLPSEVSTPLVGAGSTTEDAPMDGTETGTPGNDNRPVRAAAVQRRLFEPAETSSTSTAGPRKPEERLTDLRRLGQRQKQLDFGKNTAGYECYLQTLPKWKRQKGDPVTPDKYDPCSTRSWQGRVRVWRRSLHKWDPPTEEGGLLFTAEEAILCDMDMNIDL